MALFVSAANGRIQAANLRSSGFPVEERLWEIVQMTSIGEQHPTALMEEEADFAPLSRAISVLWHHYNGDGRQRAIWCRVVAFHAMMVKTRGSAVERWTTELEDDESVASLHSAVVNAVAEAPLSEFGEFDVSAFVSCAERYDLRITPGRAESDSPTEAQAVQVLARLRVPLSVLVGSAGLRALISRAMSTNRRSYPWLEGADVTSKGLVMGGALAARPSEEELAEGEAAVTSSLLSSLRALVGEGVATNLLTSVFGDANDLSA